MQSIRYAKINTAKEGIERDIQTEKSTKGITELACEYERYGYRRITAMLRKE
jgi:hypothetical protein